MHIFDLQKKKETHICVLDITRKQPLVRDAFMHKPRPRWPLKNETQTALRPGAEGVHVALSELPVS